MATSNIIYQGHLTRLESQWDVAFKQTHQMSPYFEGHEIIDSNGICWNDESLASCSPITNQGNFYSEVRSSELHLPSSSVATERLDASFNNEQNFAVAQNPSNTPSTPPTLQRRRTSPSEAELALRQPRRLSQNRKAQRLFRHRQQESIAQANLAAEEAYNQVRLKQREIENLESALEAIKEEKDRCLEEIMEYVQQYAKKKSPTPELDLTA